MIILFPETYRQKLITTSNQVFKLKSLFIRQFTIEEVSKETQENNSTNFPLVKNPILIKIRQRDCSKTWVIVLTIHNKTWAFLIIFFFFFSLRGKVSKRNEGKHSEMGRDFHFSLHSDESGKENSNTQKMMIFLRHRLMEIWFEGNTTRLLKVFLLVQLSRMSLEGEKFFIIKVWQMTLWVEWPRMREGTRD